MRRLGIAAVVTTLLVAAVAIGAEEGKKGKRARLNPIATTMIRIDSLKSAIESLDLTEDQKTKLGKVRDEFEPKLKAIHEKIAGLLTEDQKTAAKAALDSGKDAGKKGRALYRPVEEAVKLTDEQKEKMKPIGEELDSLIKDAMKQVNEVLTPDQKEKVEKAMTPRKRGSKKADKTESK